ncbi:aldehyde reductase II [Fusarium sp. NRRL 25303]|nr:aldehyde reductase II [Fusarium sp. NRRL 25303]
MAPLDNPAIPKGSLVLVTGVNGLLGSHVAKQFLEYGYKVRGTVRDVEKNSWLTAAFDKQYGPGNFELVAVPDLTDDKALTGAAKGTAVIAHTASIMTMDADPNNVIPAVINFAVAAIKAAYAASSVKRFVFTSSSSAAVVSQRDVPGVKVTEESWSEGAIKKAWADPPYTPDRRGAVYAASKAQAEQAIWKYHKEHHSEKPELVVNTVLPNFNWGPSIDPNPEHQGYPSSSGLPVLLFKGQVTPFHSLIVPQYYIDVEDTGRLHVAAAVFDHVKEQRIFGFAGRFSWDAILDILRKNFPNRTFPENFSGGEDPNEIEPRDKAEQLLKDLGRPGWTTLEESILSNVEAVAKAEEDPKL